MIIHRKLSELKNKILPTSLQGNYGDSLGEFSNISNGIVGAERVKGFKIFFYFFQNCWVLGASSFNCSCYVLLLHFTKFCLWANHLIFVGWGGGGELKKIPFKPSSCKKKSCSNWCRKKISCIIFWMKKMLYLQLQPPPPPMKIKWLAP